MCNNNIQPQVFGVWCWLWPLIDINTLGFASGINIDLGPQPTLNTSNPQILYSHLQNIAQVQKVGKSDMGRLMTKPTKCHMRPAKTQISPGIRPVWSVFAVCMKTAGVLSYPLSPQRRLIRLGGCLGWSESSLGAIILLVLLWGGSLILY